MEQNSPYFGRPQGYANVLFHPFHMSVGKLIRGVVGHFNNGFAS